MRWHKEGKCDRKDYGTLSHPVDGEAWQALDDFDPEFVRDSRIVRLDLLADGFKAYNTDSSSYSCWPIFIMLYNLPPNKCLKEAFIFLTLVIPSPKHPKKKIIMFLCLLMEELEELWQGVDAYDSHLKCRFNLCAV
jgi:hypothetical protein